MDLPKPLLQEPPSRRQASHSHSYSYSASQHFAKQYFPLKAQSSSPDQHPQPLSPRGPSRPSRHQPSVHRRRERVWYSPSPRRRRRYCWNRLRTRSRCCRREAKSSRSCGVGDFETVGEETDDFAVGEDGILGSIGCDDSGGEARGAGLVVREREGGRFGSGGEDDGGVLEGYCLAFYDRRVPSYCQGCLGVWESYSAEVYAGSWDTESVVPSPSTTPLDPIGEAVIVWLSNDTGTPAGTLIVASAVGSCTVLVSSAPATTMPADPRLRVALPSTKSESPDVRTFESRIRGRDDEVAVTLRRPACFRSHSTGHNRTRPALSTENNITGSGIRSMPGSRNRISTDRKRRTPNDYNSGSALICADVGKSRVEKPESRQLKNCVAVNVFPATSIGSVRSSLIGGSLSWLASVAPVWTVVCIRTWPGLDSCKSLGQRRARKARFLALSMDFEVLWRLVLTELDGLISFGVEVGESVAIGLASLLLDGVLTTRVSLSWPNCPSLLLGASSPVSLTVEGASDVSGTFYLTQDLGWHYSPASQRSWLRAAEPWPDPDRSALKATTVEAGSIEIRILRRRIRVDHCFGPRCELIQAEIHGWVSHGDIPSSSDSWKRSIRRCWRKARGGS
ncbi:hypothetical protein KC356_g43 [Hortaea werneckii]|nr:hypothetical protein KC356_g43 [Hortaea werneckii]